MKKGFYSKQQVTSASSFSNNTTKRETMQDRFGLCERCGLYKDKSLVTPKMKAHGKNKRKALLWGINPGKYEDEYGYQFHEESSSGEFLRSIAEDFGLDIDKDCVKTYACDCKTLDNREPDDKEIKCCIPRKRRVIEKYKPKVILLFGDIAIRSFYGCFPDKLESIVYGGGKKLPISSLRGKVIPDFQLGAYICHSYPPSYVAGGSKGVHVFEKDFKSFIRCLDKPRPKNVLDYSKRYKITSIDKLRKIINSIIEKKQMFAIDYESSSFRYHENIHEIYVIGITIIPKKGDNFISYSWPYHKSDRNGDYYWNKSEMIEARKLTIKLLQSDCLKIAQNMKHEEKAGRAVIGTETKNWIWDTMIGARTLDEAKGVSGLKVQTFLEFGMPTYAVNKKYIEAPIGQKNNMDDMSYNDIHDYVTKDSYHTAKLYKLQKPRIIRKDLLKGYQLLHDGSLAFADMEEEGIRLDMNKISYLKKKWGNLNQILFDTMRETSIIKKFEKAKGRMPKFGKQTAREDLLYIMYDLLKVKPQEVVTKDGKKKLVKSVDEKVMNQHLDIPFVKIEMKMRKLLKRLAYLNGFIRFSVDGFLHPSFLLDVAVSYRSSSQDPNFQNIIKRDIGGAVIRTCIIPRDGHVLREVDYDGMEVKIIASWSGDKVLMQFILDGEDPHGYWVPRIFFDFLEITEDDLSKNCYYPEFTGYNSKDLKKQQFKKMRYGSKNGFVFPLFYGSYYVSVAKDLWDFVPESMKPDIDYQDWENHIKRVEEEFWDMFEGVRKKQFEAVKEYEKTSALKMIGWNLRRHGYLSRNELFNTHIQGPAFQCLLWTINNVRKVKRKENWLTKMPGQIHDAIFYDNHLDEVDHVEKVTNDIMLDRIRKENSWIKVPLTNEWEEGYNWLTYNEKTNPEGMRVIH